MILRLPLALAVLAVALSAPLSAQTPAPATPPATTPPAAALPTPADGVLARVHGVEIRQADLDAAEEDIGGQQTAQMSPEQKREYLLSFVIDLTLAARAAEQRRIQDGPDFARRLAYHRNKLLVETLLNNETRERVTEEAMRKIYDEQRARITPEDEVRARHILVETEEEAKALIAQIRGGGDFETIAREKSKDPGGQRNGGDLGFFTKGQMVTEFAEAAFAMQPGQLSETPVKSQFGWHIIKVEERRQRPIPTFEQVRGQIEDFLTRRAQADLVQRLRSEAASEVQRFVAPPQPRTPAVPGTPGTPPAPGAAPATPRP